VRREAANWAAAAGAEEEACAEVDFKVKTAKWKGHDIEVDRTRKEKVTDEECEYWVRVIAPAGSVGGDADPPLNHPWVELSTVCPFNKGPLDTWPFTTWPLTIWVWESGTGESPSLSRPFLGASTSFSAQAAAAAAADEAHAFMQRGSNSCTWSRRSTLPKSSARDAVPAAAAELPPSSFDDLAAAAWRRDWIRKSGVARESMER